MPGDTTDHIDKILAAIDETLEEVMTDPHAAEPDPVEADPADAGSEHHTPVEELPPDSLPVQNQPQETGESGEAE